MLVQQELELRRAHPPRLPVDLGHQPRHEPRAGDDGVGVEVARPGVGAEERLGERLGVLRPARQDRRRFRQQPQPGDDERAGVAEVLTERELPAGVGGGEARGRGAWRRRRR